jgi:hypothetical protein
MDLLKSNIRRPRFSLAEVISWIAALGIALKWPLLLFPMTVVFLTSFLDGVGFSLLWTLVAMTLIGLVAGTFMAMLRAV